jgi:thioester reductase-like protein
MQQCKEGAMLAVPLPEQDVQTLLGNALSLAAINSPAQCVLSGPTAEIQTLQQYLSSLGITCQILHTSHAFHSSMMDPIIDAFISEAEHITRKPPTIPYLSNVTGTWITEEQIRDARYWATHLRQTVRFSDGLETLLQNPHTVFLEVGPGNTLCSLLKQQPHFSQERIALPSMRHPQERLSDSAVLLMALGRLWLAGIDVDWTSFYVNERRRRVSLPTYCFERQRYWIQLPESYRSDLNAGMASPDEYREPPKDLPPSPSSYLRPALQTTYAAPTNDVERRLCHMLQELLGIEKVGIHDDFFELGGHSLTAIRFLARIREVYQVDLSISSLFETTTVSGLAQQITNRLQSQEQHEAVTVEAAIDLNAEAVLAADILPTNASFEWMPEPAVLFLTGGTGFIGPVLLHELLTQTKADIYCLIRASNTDEARRRLRKQLESYTLWDESYRSRVVPVVGDLSKPFLGLAADDFHALAAKVDVIYHSGAQVNFLYPYQVLKPTNVLGTQEVIRLACSGRIKPIHYMSTVGVYDVADYAALSVIPEQAEIECSRTQNGTGYAQSKWVAERLLIGSRERGVPTTLYRAGSAGGHSKTGISNTSDVLCRLIKSCIQLELAPDIDTYLDITPVDYICRALTHLSRQKTSSNQVFHVVNPQITRWQDLVSWLISFGYPLRLISYNQWQAELVKSVDGSADNALLPLISFLAELPKEDLLRSSETSQPGISMFDTTHTRKGLSRSLIACPTVDANLISIYIAYLIRIGFLPAPEPS